MVKTPFYNPLYLQHLLCLVIIRDPSHSDGAICNFALNGLVSKNVFIIFWGWGVCWWIRRSHFFNYQLYLLNIPWQVMGWWLYSCNVWFCFQPPSFLVGPCRGFIELVGLLTCTSTPPCIWYSYYGKNISVCSHLSFATFHNKSNQIDGNARERIGYRNTEKIRRFKMGLIGLLRWEPAWNWWTEWPF